MPRILLIEDDPSVRSFMRRALERAGHDVREAADGRAGLEQLSGPPVDLVITDLIMPNMEGIEFILRLRRRDPALRVIAVSGGGRLSPKTYLDIAQACGAAKVLAKPLPIDEILAAVDEVLKG
jgi:DNA-binding response OmpR family regulator